MTTTTYEDDDYYYRGSKGPHGSHPVYVYHKATYGLSRHNQELMNIPPSLKRVSLESRFIESEFPNWGLILKTSKGKHLEKKLLKVLSNPLPEETTFKEGRVKMNAATT